mgnify:CR=1 FL=1
MSAAPRIAVVDYGMGNRRSVQKALEHVGAIAPITSEVEVLSSSDGLVIPGVGAFPRAMENLAARDLIEVIRERAREGTPLLGICLGMQLLFDGSVEQESTPGLGLIAGDVTWLSAGRLRLPHIGWNDVCFEARSALTAGLPPGGCPFYHVHWLAPRPREPADIVGSTEYGERFATMVQRGNVAGVQFHPEKSSTHGLQLLANFVGQCTASPAQALGVAPAA